jgi:hypothetical protein
MQQVIQYYGTRKMTNGNEEVGQTQEMNKIWEERLQGMPPQHRASAISQQVWICRRKVTWTLLI